MNRIVLLLTFLLISNCNLLAQQTIKGIVLNQEKERLAFVNILLDGDPGRGITTDIDGQFELPITARFDSLIFSYVGYERLVYVLKKGEATKPLQIEMQIQNLGLSEVIIIAGENPAHRIIRQVLANRDRHNPDKQTAYQCKTYNKISVDLQPNAVALEEFQQKPDGLMKKWRSRRFNKISDFHKQNDLSHFFLSETISQKSFRYPENRQETILKNQVSGLKDPHFVSLANDIQPFAFFQDQLDIGGKVFLNPISPGSTRQYFFVVEDTLYQQSDSIFLISFRPRKGKRFEGLKGVLYIHTNGYALQNVIAEPAEKGLSEIRIEQKYQLLKEGRWFPEQLNFELYFPNYPDKLIGTRMTGRSYIYEVELDQTVPMNSGNEAYVMTPKANSRSDSIWELLRPFPLAERELRTYTVMDSLSKKIRLERKIQFLESLISGRYPMGVLDLAMHRLLRFNDYEGTRLGLGLYTNEKLIKRLSLGGYVGYGFRDSTWKAGASLHWMLWPKIDFQLQVQYADDIKETASPQWFFRNGLVQRAFYADQMDRYQQWSLGLSSRLFRYGQISLGLNRSEEHPLYAYTFLGKGKDSPQTFEFVEAQLGLRYAYGERFIRLGQEKLRSLTSYPILELNYSRGLSTKFGGDYNYHRLNLALHQKFRLRGLGQTTWRIEGAIVSTDVPYSRLFASSGVGRDFDIFVLDDNFQVTAPYEFLSDRYVNLFLRHQFIRPLYRSHLSQPLLSLAYRLGYGSLENPELHESLTFDTLEKGYMESGVILDDVLRVPYFNMAYIGLGLAVFYRHGAYALSETVDNFAFRMNITFSL